jgi:flagellar hook assembly protein FlgD
VLGLSLGPNPVRARATISFSLPTASHTSLKVYSVRGQVLRTLIDCRVDQGTRSMVWDGRDNEGRRVAPGLYVVRLRSCGETRVAKVVVTH